MQLGFSAFSALVVLAFAVSSPGVADTAGEHSSERRSKSRVIDLSERTTECCAEPAVSRSEARTELIGYRPPQRGSPQARASGGVR